MSNIKSMRLSEKYKEYRKKKIIYLREKYDPPLQWRVIAKRFGILDSTVARIYKMAKDEQKKKALQMGQS